MKANIIIMLTHQDKTVGNALEVFEACKDLPILDWGFKDVGLPVDKMKELVAAMKAAGKRTSLEVVTYTEESCLRGAKLAVECGFDYLCGTIFFDSVFNFLKENGTKYFPFVGAISGSPSVLEGTPEDMIAQGHKLAQAGVDGFDLLAYRYKDGDPKALATSFVAQMDVPVVVAGSIDSPARLQAVSDIGADSFTMGSALFDEKFIKGASFRDNLVRVLEIMESID